FMGRLIPFDGQRGARVTRYLSTPALTLDDVGSYALLMAGYGGGTTLQLEQHGLATAQQALPLADDQTILARLSCGAGNAPPCLTHAGLRRAGLAVADSASTTAQPIFFVPRELIGNLLGSVIDHSIAETAGQVGANRPLQSGQPPLNSEASAPEIMPWKSNDQKNREPPTRHRPRGGGRRAPEVVIEPLPATASTERLKAAHVTPESIRRLAHVPIEIVDELIAYAEAEPTIRSKQGWLVWALQAYLAYGFRPIRAALEQPDWAALVHQSNTEVLSNELHAADTNTYVNEKAECDAEHQTAHVTGGASVVAVCAQSPEQCVEAGDVAERLRSDMRWMYGPRTWRSIEGCFAHAQAEFDGQTVRIILPAPAYRQMLAGELRQMLQRTVAAWPVASGVRPKVAISQQL
ncbi:MAG: hypothetical protein H7Z42_11585, partial [Roseiflexaceae bacterium]|nr:hypothetical protein [Roseiflexaceae bacterium]